MALPAISHEKGQGALELLNKAATWRHLSKDVTEKLTTIFQTLADYYFLQAPCEYKYNLNELIKKNALHFRDLMCNDIRLVFSEDSSFVEKSLILVQMRHFADKLEKVYTKKIDAQEKFTLFIDTPEGCLQFFNYMLTYTDWENEYYPLMEKILGELHLFYNQRANGEQKGVIQGLIRDHYHKIKKLLPHDSKFVVTLGETLHVDIQSLVFKSFHIVNVHSEKYKINEVTDLLPILHLLLENGNIKYAYREKIDSLLLLVSNYYFTEASQYERAQIRIFVNFLKKERHLERLNKTVKRFYFNDTIYYAEAPLLLTQYPNLSLEITLKNIKDKLFQVQHIVSIFEMYIHLTTQPVNIKKIFPIFKDVSDYYFNKATKVNQKKIQDNCHLYANRLNGKVPDDIKIRVPTFRQEKTSVTFPFNRLLLIVSPDLAPLTKKNDLIEIKDIHLLCKILRDFKKRGVDFPLPPQVALTPRRK